ncbi:hypothetical protein CTI12_AA090790 [Artemisia annua]|uniref:Reverse transcriptase domain-containing protein n=1 Tax=Artemisia annua TaxID=35608 RepID=A0A2U1PRQ4_ARTAN|nr:hypothetical protein CTI12_AA090790 [Artemisia annua]
MKFSVVRSPSPYNIILGRSGIKELRAIPSTIHAMMKFPTPRGVATLVTRSIIISECRKPEEKFLLGKEEEIEVPPVTAIMSEVTKTEEILVHPAYPDQLVTIGKNFSLEGIKELRAIPSTIHAMMKFPTPRGVATLVTRSIIISECRKLEEKFLLGKEEEIEVPPVTAVMSEVTKTEEILVHPAYPDQLVTIGKNFSPEEGIRPSAEWHKLPEQFKNPKWVSGQVPNGTSGPKNLKTPSGYQAKRRTTQVVE